MPMPNRGSGLLEIGKVMKAPIPKAAAEMSRTSSSGLSAQPGRTQERAEGRAHTVAQPDCQPIGIGYRGPGLARPDYRGWPRRRCRPAALRRARPGAGGHHRVQRDCGCPLDRSVSPGGRQPEHHQRTPINSGQIPELNNDRALSDFYFIDVAQPEEGSTRLSRSYGTAFPRPLDWARSAMFRCCAQ
jgi:hypothetical protein